jgi:hypothetical protein
VSEVDPLAQECARIVRYLVGAEPGPELVERYRRAHEELFRDPPSGEDQALLDAVRRHVWCLPFLDAATGLAAADSRLRRKILLVVALLETDPALAARFEPESLSLPVLIVRVGLAGVSAVLKAVVGLALYAAVRGGRGARRDAAPAAGAAGRA